MNDFVQRWSNPRIKYFKIWHWNTPYRWRRSEIIHWINHLHFFDPLHRFRRKLRTSTYLGLEPYLPWSKSRWLREFVKMRIWNLQSLLVCSIILWRVSLTENDRFFGWLSRLASLILILCLSLTLFHWMGEAALLFWNYMDSIPADKVLKRTRLELQRTFPEKPCVSQMLGGPALRLGISIVRLSIPSGIGCEWHWSTGNVGISTASWFSILKLLWITHTIFSFCNSCIRPESPKIVSWSSTNLLLAIVSKVELWNFFSSSISLRLLFWASRNSEFCCDNRSWRSCWSRRWSSSAWTQWSSSCWDNNFIQFLHTS